MKFDCSYSRHLKPMGLMILCGVATCTAAAESTSSDSNSSTITEQPIKHAYSNASMAINHAGDLDQKEGPKRVWPHVMPIFGQAVVDKGFDLPNPYGLAAIYAAVDQNLVLTDLRISFGETDGGDTPVPFVSFSNPFTDSKTGQLKLDTWLFPFMNIFANIGKIEGDGLIPVVVPGEAALKALLPPIGARCDEPPTRLRPRPAVCDKDFVLLDEPNYDGKSFTVGMVLAVGWRSFFFAAPLTYTWADLSNTDSTVKTYQGSARIGFHVKPPNTGMLAIYTGATYLDTEQDIDGTFVFDTGDPEIGEIDIGYTIHQAPADKWNYLVGANWTLTRHWWLQAEVGFGGQRDDVVASLSYRW